MHLLDANALIALSWPAHEHHQRMLSWFSRHARQGWATCALTQAAFVRIISQPAFSGRALAVAEIAEVLRLNMAHAAHRLVPLDFGFDEVLSVCSAGIIGHRQVTDAYLLTAAHRAGMKLLTFDAGVRHLLATEAERSRLFSVTRLSAQAAWRIQAPSSPGACEWATESAPEAASEWATNSACTKASTRIGLVT